MSEFPTLAEVVARHADTWHGEKRYYMQRITQPGFRSCTCGQWIDEDPAAQFSRKSFTVHVREAWADACTITTVEQLDALPMGAVIRTTEDRVALKSGESWGNASGYRSWWSAADGEEFDCSSDELDDLPALLLWHPEWSKP
ncbi:hypothetical protein [Mycolicibacterium peregrinum]|uniref:hypothetical protein n=1 Tax=Mycolicibacterium peregrinum TaxID=43304 RepID=UPI003AAE9CFA